MLRKLLVAATFVGAAAGIIGLGSALFTSTATIGANSFTTGTVAISTNPTTAAVTFSNMAPGDRIVAPITVSNSGTLDLRYAISSTATNADTKGLMNQLQLIVKVGVTDCALPAAVDTNFDAPGAPGGTVLYGPSALGNATANGLNIVGDPATGAQSGDRALTASGSEVLCLSVLLPSNSSNAFQNATTTATFAFVAEQTKNN